MKRDVVDAQLLDRRLRAAASARLTLDRPDVIGQQRQQRRVIARAGADIEHAVVRRSASTSSIRATTSGCEIVCPQAIGSATF